MKITTIKKEWYIGAAIAGGIILLALLPPLLWSPQFKDKDFPHSGEINNLTDTGFVLDGPRKGEPLTVVLTASTTVKGDLSEGQFVQVFGEMTEPRQLEARRIQVIEGPRKKDHD